MLVVALLPTVACDGWMVITHCAVRGTVQADDGVAGMPPTGRLSGEHPSNGKPVGVTGRAFEYVIAVAASGGPAVRAELIVWREGYEDSAVRAFEVMPGRLFCDGADVGVVRVAKQQSVRQ